MPNNDEFGPDYGVERDYDICVSCGGKIPVKNKFRQRHECPKKHEAARLRAHRAAYEDDDTRVKRTTPNEFSRLDIGFMLLKEDDNEE